MRATALILILAMAAGCGRKSIPVPAPEAAAVPQPIHEYTDLEAGWRLKIVAPITKSGSLDVETQAVKSEGNVIALKVSDDVIGYETAYWAIEARRGGGVSVRLRSADMTTDGNSVPIASPKRALVRVPDYTRYLRIFYLTRRSDADHNMALTGVGKAEQLESLSRAMRENPDAACASRPNDRIYCEWIPTGMAVRPEVPKKVNGVTEWQ